jgi:predicted O-methyltransferase YrrM
VAPATAAALTFLAASTRARAVVEIGTGLGVGTVALLRGMPVDGLLTTIDPDGGRQAEARLACVEAGFGPGRVRMITGSSRQVLPKLSDAGYDLVVVDGATTEFPRDLEAALRLLRPGGVVVVDDVLWSGRIADPVRREALTGALRETVRAVREDERLVPLLLPIAEGLLCAARR